MKRFVFRSLPILAGIVLACSPASGPETEPDETETPDSPSYAVEWVGKMMTVHRDGDASPLTELEPLARRDGGFAIGPVSGLRGEITVIEGKAYIARIADGAEVVTEDWAVEAPFLVHGHVNEWVEIPLPEEVNSLAELEEWLPKAANESGIESSQPYPFKVVCPAPEIEYHVIFNDEPGYQITRPHEELMKRFTLADQGATLIGVHSTEHAGVFTHHGSSTHIHVVSDDQKHSGHVDAAQFGAGATLRLPKT